MDLRAARAPVLAGVALLLLALSGCMGGSSAGVVRLGYFPNLTHAQALYGLETGLFQEALGPSVELRPVDFNAGPTAMDALLAGSIDIVYVGPSPTISVMATTGDDVVRIIAGAASGGARFIVQPGLADAEPAEFAGKTLATPGLGNTQDVSLKHWLKENGLRTRDAGGNVQVHNAQNPEILTLFLNGDIHGAWVPEPWAVRLEQDAGGVEYLDEADRWTDGEFVTTHLVTTRDYLRDYPLNVKAILQAHVRATLAVQAGDAAVLDAVNAGIEAATGKPLGSGLLADAFPRVDFTYDPLASTLYEFADMADDLGFLRDDIPAAHRVYDLTLLNEVLTAEALDPVSTQ